MRKELITHRNPKSPNSEIFRTLRTNIQFMSSKQALKTLLVTSTFPGEGKSWVASNLAVTFAQAGKKVILIDADMRKGRQYAIFGVSPKPGLSNYLSQEITNGNIGQYIQETEVENLYIIPAGNVPPNPSELLVSSQMLNLLDELKELCDLIVIDGTPCELVADSIILSRIVDSSIIVTAHKITKKDALQRVVKNINNVGGKLAGVVINKMPMSNKKYDEQYYYYGERNLDIDKKSAKGKRVQSNIGKRAKQTSKEMEENIAKLHKEMTEIEKSKNVDNHDKTIFNEKQIDLNNSTSQIKENNSTKFENDNTFMEKTNEIIKQINDYIDEEKKKLQ